MFQGHANEEGDSGGLSGWLWRTVDFDIDQDSFLKEIILCIMNNNISTSSKCKISQLSTN